MFFFGYILPYAAAAVFVVGMVRRTWDWLSRPVPLPLTVSSVAGGRRARAAAVAKELVLFPSLYRGDRRLWLSAWLMHASLLVVLVGHTVGIAFAAQQFRYFGASKEASVWLSGAMGLLVGLVFTVALLTVLYRRAANVEVKRISGPDDYLALVLLLCVAASGLAMRYSAEVDLAEVRTYLAGLLVFRASPLPRAWLFLVHFAAVNALLLYFPFSKLVHLTGAFVGRSLLVQPPPVYPTPADGPTAAPLFSQGDRP
ncbi:MAG: respiratory nitrate reductase subunit gamma [Pirellulales bacterium]|nr:respiratory nitrate reductase subunit gamma [Pirellulales bacterium]